MSATAGIPRSGCRTRCLGTLASGAAGSSRSVRPPRPCSRPRVTPPRPLPRARLCPVPHPGPGHVPSCARSPAGPLGRASGQRARAAARAAAPAATAGVGPRHAVRPPARGPGAGPLSRPKRCPTGTRRRRRPARYVGTLARCSGFRTSPSSSPSPGRQVPGSRGHWVIALPHLPDGASASAGAGAGAGACARRARARNYRAASTSNGLVRGPYCGHIPPARPVGGGSGNGERGVGSSRSGRRVGSRARRGEGGGRAGGGRARQGRQGLGPTPRRLGGRMHSQRAGAPAPQGAVWPVASVATRMVTEQAGRGG